MQAFFRQSASFVSISKKRPHDPAAAVQICLFMRLLVRAKPFRLRLFCCLTTGQHGHGKSDSSGERTAAFKKSFAAARYLLTGAVQANTI